MAQTLQAFAKQCHDILQLEDSPASRGKIAALLRQALNDAEFVDAQFDAESPERKIIYEDPDLGFCILAHNYLGAKASPPHDHGPSWAIYGQARGETLMSDWDLVEPASADKPGKVKKKRDYKLEPGDAHVYNEGDLHSPTRNGPTRLIRLEGVNMDTVRRLQFRPV